jgi:hypothetical protein
LQLFDSVPVGSVTHLGHVELLKLVDQPLCVQRSCHLMKRFPVTLWVLQAEVLVIESRTPSLEPEKLGLFEIHRNGFAVQILYACTVIATEWILRAWLDELHVSRLLELKADQ